IQAVVNLQHDCASAHCKLAGKQVIYQEREATTQSRVVLQHVDDSRFILQHVDDSRFILNTQALHNYQVIAATIPASLRTFSPLVPDR
ncbi:hypothetical protein CPB83DRAFT_736203, partial [Crepidotus variabilis]